MRRLITFNMMFLDGFFEGPNHDLSWHNVDEEFGKFADEQTASFGLLLFGRVTYEMMASFWQTPDASRQAPIVGDLMNRLPKVVASRTLKQAEWNNTRLVRGNIAEEISKLKQQSGNDLALFGSANLMATLSRLELIDEHRVMVNPVILGHGTPLFQGLNERLKLKLAGTRTFRNGNVLLFYETEKTQVADIRKEIAVAFLKLVASGAVSDTYAKFLGTGFRHHYLWFEGSAQARMKEM